MIYLLIGTLAIGTAILIVEMLIATQGKSESFTNPNRQPVVYGQGPKEIKYLVMGDSTAAGRGGNYQAGIAVASAQYLAKDARVTLLNLATSGGRTSDVLAEQMPLAQNFQPDMVLIAVGANDVTHLTARSDLQRYLKDITEQLVAINCNVKIVLTGAADMGAIPRFAQPLRSLAGWRTTQLNQVFQRIVLQDKLTFAPIAEEIGPEFRRRPELFAADRFHPNNQGYDLWSSVITKALDQAMATQPSHCH